MLLWTNILVGPMEKKTYKGVEIKPGLMEVRYVHNYISDIFEEQFQLIIHIFTTQSIWKTMYWHLEEFAVCG